jgi:hypothetical protein
MEDLETEVRALVAREVAPLIAQCELIRAQINRTEAALPILLDKRERDAVRVDAIMRRARLECVLSELHSVEERVLRLADERWPQWRT